MIRYEGPHLSINGVDVSSSVSNFELTEPWADDAEIWRHNLAGLEVGSLSMTVDNTSGIFAAQGGPIFREPKTRITVQAPDGRWQSIRLRLKHLKLWRWQPFANLKIRYATYGFEGVLHSWDGINASYQAGSTIERGSVTQ